MTKGEAASVTPAPAPQAAAGTTAAPGLRAHPPEVSAARARRWGAFYYAEQVLRVMKGYGWTIVMYGVGQPVAYLFAMGVGLATLVEANGAGVFGGVSYLAFIAPALLISAAVMTAANEFTFPVMDGFKWRRVYYGPHASPLTPEQIAGGQIIAVTVRFLLQSAIYFAVVALFGASPGAWAWVSILVATLAGLSFGLPLMAYAASIKEDKGQFAMVMRFIVMPLFLFSGTFFPLDTLPARRPLDRLDFTDLARNGTWPGGQLRVRGSRRCSPSSTSSSCWAWRLPAGSSPSASSPGGWAHERPDRNFDAGTTASPTPHATGASGRCTPATPAP